jgi:hypothetical protein
VFIASYFVALRRYAGLMTLLVSYAASFRSKSRICSVFGLSRPSASFHDDSGPLSFARPATCSTSRTSSQSHTLARFTRQSFPRSSSQRHRICGWENPGVLTSYTLVSVLVTMMYVHVVTANKRRLRVFWLYRSISLDV